MFEVRDDIKDAVRKAGMKMTDLSRSLKLNYDILNAYINGRRRMPEKIEVRIQSVLEQWGVGTV